MSTIYKLVGTRGAVRTAVDLLGVPVRSTRSKFSTAVPVLELERLPSLFVQLAKFVLLSYDRPNPRWLQVPRFNRTAPTYGS